MEAYQSNEWKSVNQNDFVQDFDDSEQYSMLETKDFQNFQTEFQPTEIQGLIGYPCENTALQYNQQIEGIFMEPHIYNGEETPSHWQNHFQVEQPKSLFECKFSNGANTKLRPERVEEDSFGIPFDNRRTSTARDALLGMDSLNNECLSQTIDSLLLEIPPSDFNFLDSKDKTSILKDELLATNFGSTIDNSCENAELSNNPFQHDLSVERLKPYWTYLNSKTFTEDCNFQTHAKSNFERLYHCDTCLNKFHSKDMLLKHKCIFSRDNPFQYEIYERNFSPTGNLSETKSAHSNEKFFQCVICKQTLLQTDFEWHMLTHNASPNQGDISKEKISETEHFNSLMCMDTEKKLHQCQVCKKKFSRKQNLTRHIRTHTGEKPYECYLCMRKFSSATNLKTHIRTHTKDKPYQCHVCERKFSQKAHLTQHNRMHTGEKPHECYLCKRKFSDSRNLKTHIRIHTKEKPYQCHVCEKKFLLKKTLTTHMRTHTGEKPHECHLCKCKFSHITTLNNHLRTHTEERFFRCHLCQRNFSRKAHLKIHMCTHIV